MPMAQHAPGPGLANWGSPAFRGSPRVERGRELIQGSRTSRVHAPACVTRAPQSHRRPEERTTVADLQARKLIITWEGLAPKGAGDPRRGPHPASPTFHI